MSSEIKVAHALAEPLHRLGLQDAGRLVAAPPLLTRAARELADHGGCLPALM